MSRRTLEQLNSQKQKKVTVSNGYPSPTEGTNGEIQIRLTKDNGPMMFEHIIDGMLLLYYVNLKVKIEKD